MIHNLEFDTSQLTFIAAANKGYVNFIEPFIIFCKESNPQCKIEIWADEPQRINYVDSNVRIHQLPKNYNPATYRYITEPTYETQHVYITDIDIMHTEFVQPFHLLHMETTGLPFSNIRRSKKGETTRLSGLHFVKRLQWYTATKDKRSTINLKNQDEKILFEIAASSFDIEKFSNGLANRPVHGIHCSTEGKPRSPYAKLGWELTSQKVAFFEEVIKKHGTFNEYFEKQVCEPLLGRK
jgi:hypothetical protein